MSSFPFSGIQSRITLINGKGASQKRVVIIGSSEHDKLSGFRFIGNGWAVDFKQEIDLFYFSVFQDNSISLNSHISSENRNE